MAFCPREYLRHGPTRVEYLAIVEAGFRCRRRSPHGDALQPGRQFHDRGLPQVIALRVEAITTHYISKTRSAHTCYSTNIAPRVHDFELRHFADLMLQVRAAAYLVEAANPRHEHEWAIWQDLKLPDDKIVVPGVVSHCVHLVEHPELVAQRIIRFADVVGRERVIAGTDCGFGTSGAGDEVHPDVAWAKLRALVEGARLASQRLF